MKRPQVIDPPDYTFDDSDDPGVCSCPVCYTLYEYAGRVIRCECGFAFPTDWWSMYSKGCTDGMRVRNGGVESGGMRRRKEHHPYYRHGFENPVATSSMPSLMYGADHPTIPPCSFATSADAWKVKVVGSIESIPVMRDFSYCDRCGKDKTDGRECRSGLCQQCEADSTCKHLERKDTGGIGLDYVCRAGVDIKAHVGDSPGWATRLPCRYFEGGCPIACGQFTPVGIESVLKGDEAMAISIAKTLAALAVVPDIKKEHKGENWQGVVDCPVCNGRLHVSHAAYNGHVHGQCETADCVSWME